MDLEKMTIEQLKALAYDQIVLIEQCQNNLRIINQEIQKRINNEVGNKDFNNKN